VLHVRFRVGAAHARHGEQFDERRDDGGAVDRGEGAFFRAGQVGHRALFSAGPFRDRQRR
jgi:hypothetical protein